MSADRSDADKDDQPVHAPMSAFADFADLTGARRIGARSIRGIRAGFFG